MNRLKIAKWREATEKLEVPVAELQQMKWLMRVKQIPR